MIESVLLFVGRYITRFLLHPTIRNIPGSISIYAKLYLVAKSVINASERSFLLSKINAGDTILDIGANVGFFTKAFANKVGSQGQVFAFEPDPLMFDVLSGLNTATHIHLYNLALGNYKGNTTLYCNTYNRADNRLFHSQKDPVEEITVEIDSLDSWIKQKKITKIDGCKIDVQGSELAILRGMKAVLSDTPPHWIFFEFSPHILEKAGEDPNDIWKLLEMHGYKYKEFSNGQLQALDSPIESKRCDWYTNIFAYK